MMKRDMAMQDFLVATLLVCFVGAALVLSFQQLQVWNQQWKVWKARRVDPGLPHPASQNAQERNFGAEASTNPVWRSPSKLGRNTTFVPISILISVCWI